MFESNLYSIYRSSRVYLSCSDAIYSSRFITLICDDADANWSIFKIPYLLLICVRNPSIPLTLGVQFQMTPSPSPLLQTITNQSKKIWSKYNYYMLSSKFIVIKRWLYCLTSESKGIFLANNILTFDLVMTGHDANPILLIKQNKDWTFRILATSYPLPIPPASLITSHFCHTNPLTPSPGGRHMCINRFFLIISLFIICLLRL